jgi:menaquinone-9 beta-reductase
MTSSVEIKDYDILIVGGGPAGLSTWLHLNKEAPEIAAKSLVIDKQNFPRDKVCGGAIGGWCPYILDKLRVKVDFPRINISELNFVYENKKLTLHHSNYFTMARRKDFDYRLVTTGLERGLSFHEHETFLDLTRTDDGLIVKTDRGKYRVKILIAADGSMSAIRSKVKLGREKPLARTLELFLPVSKNDEEYEKKSLTMDLNPIRLGLQGYIWHFPAPDNMMCHGIGDLRITKDSPQQSLKNILSEKLSSRGITINKNLLRGFPIRCYRDEFISLPNILFAGDSAGIEQAFGGGIHFALSYGSIAAKAIIEARQTDDYSFLNYQKDFESDFSGKFMKKCNIIGQKLYTGKMSPFNAAREVFELKKPIF